MNDNAATAGDLPMVGAFEADAWAGLVFVLGAERGLSVRLRVRVDGHDLSPRDLFLLAREIGPCAEDGAYARVAFDLTLPLPPTTDTPIREARDSERTLTWEWARLDAQRVAIRIAAVRALGVGLECGAPWDWTSTWRATASGAEGWADAGTTRGEPDIVLSVLQPSVVEATLVDRGVELQGDPGHVPLIVIASLAGAAAGETFVHEDVSRAIDRAAVAYDARRVDSSGTLQDAAASITNNLHWMVLLQPEVRRRYVPAGRRWIFPREAGGRDHWTIFEWDGFLNALLLSLESPPLAREMLDAVIGTQYPSGNIPNWRGRFHGTPDRSQPPIGAFIVLKLARRLGDVALVQRALPALDRWHAWWQRRRRPSGLYAWGSTLQDIPSWVPSWEREASHRQKAAWESGQDDLPNWDGAAWDADRSTLAMDCVDLSALLALDAECLGALHEFAGDRARAAEYHDEHRALCAAIDRLLWDERRGVYADRLDSGAFSARVAATNMLPLLAGAGDASRVARLCARLSDPHHFGGEWIVPTVERADPAFADQQYWRGTIWPPTNFLVYEALHRVGAVDVAATVAERSVALFVHDWREHQVCRENFSSIDGGGGGQRHQSWAPLFAWIGLAELADVTPWDGLRLGTTRQGATCTLSRLTICGRTWDVRVNTAGMSIDVDGGRWFEADAPVRLRQVVAHDGVWRAEIDAPRGATIRVAGGPARRVPEGRNGLEWPC